MLSLSLFLFLRSSLSACQPTVKQAELVEPDEPSGRKKARPAEARVERPIYFSTKHFAELERQKSFDLADDLVSLAEGAAEVYAEESASFFTSGFCCALLWLLAAAYAALGAVAVATTCAANRVAGGGTAVGAAALAFAAASFAAFACVGCRRDRLRRWELPCVAVLFGAALVVLGVALGVSLAINFNQVG